MTGTREWSARLGQRDLLVATRQLCGAARGHRGQGVRIAVDRPSARTHLAVAGAELDEESAAATGAPRLTGLRRELARLSRGTAGDSVPPLRPLW
ncbi:hypothetical protein [Actinokineospora sp. NBRC 105648]|uniref:hypothetical protein n=1 Tax=Actinokineospora sp. NBRC 105648 TaxID=3032206 RepID=UPI00249FA833|nr:hypothetical protein [Actinokineospora sp. NBRC 105648]GLZ36581.1 hypothetical protein Acsp05_02060 [Actinokineospora sp. NBRC 105648]